MGGGLGRERVGDEEEVSWEKCPAVGRWRQVRRECRAFMSRGQNACRKWAYER